MSLAYRQLSMRAIAWFFRCPGEEALSQNSMNWSQNSGSPCEAMDLFGFLTYHLLPVQAHGRHVLLRRQPHFGVLVELAP